MQLLKMRHLSENQNSKNHISSDARNFFYTALLFSILSLTHADISAQTPTTTKTQTNKKIGVASTVRTVDEMQSRIAKNLLESKAEADALDEAWPYISELDIKAIDDLVDCCDKKIIGRGTAKGSIFFLICKKHKNTVLRNYVQSKIKAGRYTEKDLEEIIGSSILIAGLTYIKK